MSFDVISGISMAYRRHIRGSEHRGNVVRIYCGVFDKFQSLKRDVDLSAPCGMIIGCETFYGAEGVGSVII